MSQAPASEKAKEAVEILLQLAHCVELRDHTRGRIRTRVSLSNVPKAMSLLQRLDVSGGLQLIPGLKEYEVSAWSQSATILYDPGALPFDLWTDFCAIRKDPSLEESVRKRLYALFEDRSHRSRA